MSLFFNHETNDISIVGGGTPTINSIGPGDVSGMSINSGSEPSAGTRGVSIGEGASTTTDAVAIGPWTAGSAAGSVAIGGGNSGTQRAQATAGGHIAIGAGANFPVLADATFGIAIGKSATARAPYTCGMGAESNATSGDSFTLGSETQGQNRGVSVGGSATENAGARVSYYGNAIGTGAISNSATVVLGRNTTVYDPGNQGLRGANLLGYNSDSSRFQVTQYTTSSTNYKQGFQVVSATTTDATQTTLFCPWVNQQSTIPGLNPGSTNAALLLVSDSTVAFKAYVVARRTDADNESAAYKITGCIDNNAGVVSLVGAPVVTVLAEDTAAWDVVVEANDTTNELQIKVTGEAAKTIRWCARVEYSEVVG
jgi:hypothetical protein